MWKNIVEDQRISVLLNRAWDFQYYLPLVQGHSQYCHFCVILSWMWMLDHSICNEWLTDSQSVLRTSCSYARICVYYFKWFWKGWTDHFYSLILMRHYSSSSQEIRAHHTSNSVSSLAPDPSTHHLQNPAFRIQNKTWPGSIIPESCCILPVLIIIFDN